MAFVLLVARRHQIDHYAEYPGQNGKNQEKGADGETFFGHRGEFFERKETKYLIFELKENGFSDDRGELIFKSKQKQKKTEFFVQKNRHQTQRVRDGGGPLIERRNHVLMSGEDPEEAEQPVRRLRAPNVGHGVRPPQHPIQAVHRDGQKHAEETDRGQHRSHRPAHRRAKHIVEDAGGNADEHHRRKSIDLDVGQGGGDLYVDFGRFWLILVYFCNQKA